jgi:hypothetical protein
MNDLSAADIAARVVAWHNRHPLARRLRAADVFSVGHVALPFLDLAAAPPEPAAGGGGSLRERAMARAREATGAPAPAPGTPLQAAFRDDFIPPLSPAEVAVFGARHGIERPHEPGGAPVRRVPAQVGSGGLAWRWLLTAELRAGGARTRVLLGPVPGAPVLGRRLWSLPRVGALAALGGAAVALVLAMGLGGGRDDGPAPVAVLPGAVVQPAAAVASMAAPASAAAVASAVASAAASAPTAAVAAAASAASPVSPVSPALPAASRPIDVEPRLGKIDLPPIGGFVDARRRQAAAAAASAASAAPGAVPNAPPSAATAAAPAAAASAPVFALATPALRTRAESQQIAEALTALLVVPGSTVKRVDVLPTGDDFRVVAWPYAGRTEAQQAQARLLARGHRLQVISF